MVSIIIILVTLETLVTSIRGQISFIKPLPVFSSSYSENVGADLGGDVTLHCQVKNISDLGKKIYSIFPTNFCVLLNA